MFRSISRVFFVLICASGATVAVAENEKIDKDITLAATCRVSQPNGTTSTTSAINCASTAPQVCYGNNGDGFATMCVEGCQTCHSGFTLTTAYGTADEAISLKPCTFEYKTCKCNIICPEISSWRPMPRGNYEMAYKGTLDARNCLCRRTYRYRCKNGYYNALSATDAVVNNTKNLSCERCPQVPDKGYLSYGTSKAGYNAGISSCYTDKGDSYSHKVQEGIKTKTIGKYRLSADCYYDQPSN